MSLPEIVGWLREHLSAPWLAIEDGGQCSLHFDTLSVSLVPHDEPAGFCASTRLGHVAGARTETLAQLLQANLFSDGVGANVIALDTQGTFLLSRRYAFDRLAREEFLPGFDRFIQQAVEWQQRLAADEPATPPLMALHV